MDVRKRIEAWFRRWEDPQSIFGPESGEPGLGFVNLQSRPRPPKKPKIVPITNALTAPGPDNWKKV